MTAEFEANLIECLSALDAGESVEQVLARFPADAPELRPVLTVATALPTLRVLPSEAQKMASREAFLKQAAELRQPVSTPHRFFLGAMGRLATTIGALALILVVLGGGAVAASGSALPGDPLYGLKRSVESVRLGLTASGTARADLEHGFEQARVREVSALLEAGREVEVEFRGPVSSIQADRWIVAGLVVRVSPDTQVVGAPELDRLAQVRGLTTAEGLVAHTITIEPGSNPSPTPTPSPTPLPTWTPTVLPTSTPTEPRPTREPPTPTVTPPPAPTPTSTPEPTALPAEIEFTGTVDSQGEIWSISGVSVTVTADTEFKGNIGLGQRVKVKALRFADGRLVALSIELENEDDDGDGQSNDNQNGNENDDDENDNHNDNENDDDENDNHNDNRNSNDNRNDND